MNKDQEIKHNNKDHEFDEDENGYCYKCGMEQFDDQGIKMQCNECLTIFTGIGDLTCPECEGIMHEIINTSDQEIEEKGCGKEIEVKFGTILGTCETCKTKCGWWCDGEQRFCDDCKFNLTNYEK